ncbi:hypothetical protein MRB53_040430 [Persea americana]|nr:hypothetical protein MRB53_040430 [Persea americana]
MDRQLQYLTEASRILSEVSPSISRSIGNYTNEVKFSLGIENENEVCQTCGAYLVAGKTSSLRRGRIICLLCHRSRMVQREKKPRRAALLARQRGLETSKSSVKKDKNNIKTRERKKLRKQGLFANLKTSNKQDTGLNLSDFML